MPRDGQHGAQARIGFLLGYVGGIVAGRVQDLFPLPILADVSGWRAKMKELVPAWGVAPDPIPTGRHKGKPVVERSSDCFILTRPGCRHKENYPSLDALKAAPAHVCAACAGIPRRRREIARDRAKEGSYLFAAAVPGAAPFLQDALERTRGRARVRHDRSPWLYGPVSDLADAIAIGTALSCTVHLEESDHA
jgi:hypothetical protein